MLVKSVSAASPKTDREADLALLSATAEGDRAAFERLHRRYYKRLLSFAHGMVQRWDVAEEVAGDTLFVVWRKAGEFQGASKPSTWIFGIAYRTALSARRGRARHAGEVTLDSAESELISPPANIDAIFERKRLARAMLDLSPEHRAVVQLTYFHHMSYGEISEAIGCPVGTVKTRMMHARKRLRASLSDAEAGQET